MTDDRRMTRERWERLAPFVDAVLDQPPERRAGYISEISAGDAALAAELSRFNEFEENEDALFRRAEEERSALVSDRRVDVLAKLQASLGTSYVVEREIGGGGMSRVFAARQLDLDRAVVIKVLPPELAQHVSAERFAREIKLAASLQQANIVPVLAAGTVAALPYYTMPFVEGSSLRERLARDGALPISDAIGILRDVARALAFAHGRGVVHRDIKPGNILLSDRTAVVVDFGIAKAVAAADDDSTSRIANGSTKPGDLTNDGVLIGTPAYMAPEQAMAGANVDHRADIYAFGCVAFEILTGKPAFSGANASEIIAAKLERTPETVTSLRPGVPLNISRLVVACLAKDAALRPQTADSILRSLDSASVLRTSRAVRGLRVTIAAMSLAVVAAIAWRFYNSKSAVPAVETTNVKPAETTNLEAFDSYSLGQTQLKHRGSDVAESIKSFRKAIDLDSTFAPAHSALATALGLEPFFDGTSPKPLIEEAIVEAHRALAIDTTLAEAWVALGIAQAMSGHWAAADSDMGRAIKLEPRNAIVRHTYARQLILSGRATEAMTQLELARSDDRTSPVIWGWLSYASFLDGQRDSAFAQATRTIQLDSTLLATRNFASLVNLALGRTDVVRRILSAPIAKEMTNAPYLYAKLGDPATANRLLRDMESRDPHPWFLDVAKASVLLAANDSAGALSALERSDLDSGPLWVFYIPLGDPAFDSIRHSRRFKTLLERANLDSTFITAPRKRM